MFAGRPRDWLGWMVWASLRLQRGWRIVRQPRIWGPAVALVLAGSLASAWWIQAPVRTAQSALRAFTRADVEQLTAVADLPAILTAFFDDWSGAAADRVPQAMSLSVKPEVLVALTANTTHTLREAAAGRPWPFQGFRFQLTGSVRYTSTGRDLAFDAVGPTGIRSSGWLRLKLRPAGWRVVAVLNGPQMLDSLRVSVIPTAIPLVPATAAPAAPTDGAPGTAPPSAARRASRRPGPAAKGRGH